MWQGSVPWHNVHDYERSGIGAIITINDDDDDGDGNENTPVMLPLVECLLPVVTKSFGQTSQCEWGEEGFPRWDPSSGAASPRGARSRSEPPETRRGPWWAARALTGRRSRQAPGILQWPDVGSKHQTNVRAGLLGARTDPLVSTSLSESANKVVGHKDCVHKAHHSYWQHTFQSSSKFST